MTKISKINSQYITDMDTTITKNGNVLRNTLEQSVENLERIPQNRDLFINTHLKWALHMATQYYFRMGLRHKFATVPYDDVVQAANVGLVMAAEKYCENVEPSEDGTPTAPKKDSKFSTYSYFWIKKYILLELNINGQQLSMPQRAAFAGACDDLLFISKDADIKKKEYDFNNGENEKSVMDLLDDSTDGANPLYLMVVDNAQTGICTTFDIILSRLTQKERLTIQATYGLAPFDRPRSNKEVSELLGVHKSTVSNNIKNAIQKLGDTIKKRELDIINDCLGTMGNFGLVGDNLAEIEQ